MIRSSIFTFDESSVWDPKVIRQYLDIPEDQLNILRNLPEWSKDTNNGNTLRIEKDIIFENSLSSKLISDTILEKNKELNKQNLELFEENFQIRKNILNAYRSNAVKLSKSISLFEIDKIDEISPTNNSLKSALSVPDLYLFSEKLCLKNPSFEFRRKDSLLEKHSSSLGNVNLPKKVVRLFNESSLTCRSLQTSKDISELEKSECESVIEKSKMEVDSLLPLAIPSDVDLVKSNDSNIENKTVPTSNILKSPSKLKISSSDQTAFVTTANKLDNSNFIVEIKTSTLDSCEKNERNFNTVEETMPSNNSTHNASEKVPKLTEDEGMNSCEKNKSDLITVKETVPMDVNSTKRKIVERKDFQKLTETEDFQKLIETVKDLQECTKGNEILDRCYKSYIDSKEKCTSKVNLVSSDDPESKASLNSHSSKMNAENAQQIIHKDISDNKSVLPQTLASKRKLESKNKSTKKRRSTREKKGSLEERSIKKAGEICYSAEEIKTMLDMMRQFL